MGVTNAKTGLKIQGAINSYMAGTGGVDAGDFIKTTDGTFGTGTSLSSVQYSAHRMSTTKLDSTHVFVAHSYSSTRLLYGMVCTVSGTTVTAGTDTALSSASDSGYSIFATAIDSEHVLVTYIRAGTLYAMVCTVSGTTVTAGTETSMGITAAVYFSTGVALDSEHVMILYGYKNASDVRYTHAMVCTVSGTTVTAGTDTQISSTGHNNVPVYAGISKIDSSRVFVADGGEFQGINGTVCTISGTTISVGTATVIASSGEGVDVFPVINIDGSHIFVAYRGYNTIYLHGTICTVSGTIVTAGTDTQISTTGNSAYSTVSVLLDSTHIYVIYAGNTYIIIGRIITVSGTAFTLGTETTIYPGGHSADILEIASLNDVYGFVLFYTYDSTYHYLQAIVHGANTATAVSSSSDTIAGVSKQTKAEGEVVQVYVPNV